MKAGSDRALSAHHDYILPRSRFARCECNGNDAFSLGLTDLLPVFPLTDHPPAARGVLFDTEHNFCLADIVIFRGHTSVGSRGTLENTHWCRKHGPVHEQSLSGSVGCTAFESLAWPISCRCVCEPNGSSRFSARRPLLLANCPRGLGRFGRNGGTWGMRFLRETICVQTCSNRLPAHAFAQW